MLRSRIIRSPDTDRFFSAGIAAVLKAASPEARVIGCQPAASDVMAQSVKAGAILDIPSEDTLSDGTAGRPSSSFLFSL